MTQHIDAETVALALFDGAAKTSRGYMTRCPAHDDRTPSLWVVDRDDGTGVTAHCFAGCGYKDILAACQGVGVKLAPKKADTTPVIEQLYPYRLYDGQESGAVKERWIRADGRPLKEGKAKWARYGRNEDGTPYKMEQRKPELPYDILYNGHLIGDADTVYVVEGEKDAETGRNRFLACVSLPSASGFRWSAETERLLEGRRVVLIPDNDTAGHKAMEKFGQACCKAGLETLWLDLPGLGVKEDLTDWYAHHGGTTEALVGLVARLEPLEEADFGWRGLLEYTDGGKPVATWNNAQYILEHAREFRGRLSYDAFRQMVLLDGAEPGEAIANELGMTMVALTGFSSSNDGQIRTAMLGAAHQKRFDSLQEHILELPAWDGAERIDAWLQMYCGAEGHFASLVGRKFLIGMVARAMDPGCKFDTALVLEGEQGRGKSTLCNILGGDFYSANMPDLSNKTRTSEEIQGVWLVEDAEMESASKQDVKRLKAFLSTQTDRFRGAYMVKPINAPRRCVVVITTNRTDYLVDETGHRRFWPVKCNGYFDLDGLKSARDQLLAEAYAEWVMGATCYLEGADIGLQDEVARQRFDMEGDEAADMLGWYLNIMPTGRLSEGTPRKTTLNVVHVPTMLREMRRADRVPVGSTDRALSINIGKVLRHRGWSQKSVRQETHVCKAWVYGDATPREGASNIVVTRKQG